MDDEKSCEMCVLREEIASLKRMVTYLYGEMKKQPERNAEQREEQLRELMRQEIETTLWKIEPN